MSEPDLKILWKSQETEEPPMALDEIRRKARRFQGGVRIRNLIEYLAGLIVVPSFALWAWRAPELPVKLGAAMVVVGSLFALWQLHLRSGARRPPEASAVALMDFHRAELIRQRDALRTVPLWYLAPFAPGMFTLLIYRLLNPVEKATRSLEADRAMSVMMIIIVVLLFAVVGLTNALAAHRLQAKLDELDRLGRA